MNLRAILLCAALAVAASGCANVDDTPAPPPATTDPGPPASEAAPITGGELFNGNY
jgi:hypothetical protein